MTVSADGSASNADNETMDDAQWTAFGQELEQSMAEQRRQRELEEAAQRQRDAAFFASLDELEPEQRRTGALTLRQGDRLARAARDGSYSKVSAEVLAELSDGLITVGETLHDEVTAIGRALSIWNEVSPDGSWLLANQGSLLRLSHDGGRYRVQRYKTVQDLTAALAVIEAEDGQQPLWRRVPSMHEFQPVQPSRQALQAFLHGGRFPALPGFRGECDLPADGSGPGPGYDEESGFWYSEGRILGVLTSQHAPALVQPGGLRGFDEPSTLLTCGGGLRGLRELALSPSGPWRGSMSDLTAALGWDGTPEKLYHALKKMDRELEAAGVLVSKTGGRCGPSRATEWMVGPARLAIGPA